MTQDTLELIRARTSVNHFDPTRTLSDDEISELVSYAIEAPSSFNQQNWRFIAVREQSAKEKLKSVAFGQQKIADAAVTFIVIGRLRGYESLPKAFKPLVDAGAMPQAALDGLVGMAGGIYAPNPAIQRDEAIRSASLAAATLMLAAQAKGLVSGPMIGFDPVAVAKEFGLDENDIPALLISVGYAGQGNWPRKPRFPVAEVLSFS